MAQTSFSSSVSPAVDFDSPPQVSACLDSSAAKHKLSLKPRNQRSGTKGRRPLSNISRVHTENLSDVNCTLEENVEEEEKETSKDVFADDFILSEVGRTEPVIKTFHESADISAEFSLPQPAPQQDKESGSFLEKCLSKKSSAAVPAPVNAELTKTELESKCTPPVTDSVDTSPDEKQNFTKLNAHEETGTDKPAKIATKPRLFFSKGESQVVSTSSEEDVRLPNAASSDNTLSKQDVWSDCQSSLDGAEGKDAAIGELKGTLDSSENERALERAPKESSVIVWQNSEESFSHKTKSSSSTSESAAVLQVEVTSQVLEKPKHAAEHPTPEKDPPQVSVHAEASVKKTDEKVAGEHSALRKSSNASLKFSVLSARDRTKTGSIQLRTDTEDKDECTSHKVLPNSPKHFFRKENQSDELVGTSVLDERKMCIKKQESFIESAPKNVEKPVDKNILTSVPQTTTVVTKSDDPTDASKERAETEEKCCFGVKLRSTSLSIKYRENPCSDIKTIKRYSAEINLVRDETAETKPSSDASLGSSFKDSVKMKARSSEQLNVKPPLARKPVLQTTHTINMCTMAENQVQSIKPMQARNGNKEVDIRSSASKTTGKTFLKCVVASRL
ncbi:CRACD-like protein [Latimeria chalumnae]|uniref:CRACD-like protein n=1 Tax=Latimeria chalumnae TaxID=7897 RepID=UPI00313C3D79